MHKVVEFLTAKIPFLVFLYIMHNHGCISILENDVKITLLRPSRAVLFIHKKCLNNNFVAIIYFMVLISRFMLHISVYIFYFCYFDWYIICILNDRAKFLVSAGSSVVYSTVSTFFQVPSISCEPSH
jgi:hypothetical protein